jgi:pimeloyl-ACP methyl ester carboxylesterase
MQALQDLFGPLRSKAGLAFRTVGNGPTLLLVHGGSGSRTHWIRNVSALARRFEIVTVDLPGFGESATPPGSIDPADYMDWVADALELRLGHAPFAMAGFSFGGTTTAAVAARLAARGRGPERISLVSPSGFGQPNGRTVSLERLHRGPETPMAEIRAATARNLGKWMLAATPTADDESVDIQLDNVARARFDSRPISFRDSLLEDLRAAGAPVQVLLGQGDPLIFPSLDARAARIRESVPGVQLDLLDGGHWLQYEASEEVNRRLTQFHLPRNSS